MADYGIKGALDLLKKLTPKERDRLLSQVSQSDAKLANTLRSKIFTIQDLKKFSDLQWLDLITHVSFEDIAYSLMALPMEERKQIISPLPEITQKKIIGLFDPQVIPMARLNEARERVLAQIDRILG